MSITVLTAMSEPPRRFDVFTGTGRRRSFTAAEKATIVAESYGGEDSVCGVARRHGLGGDAARGDGTMTEDRTSRERNRAAFQGDRFGLTGLGDVAGLGADLVEI